MYRYNMYALSLTLNQKEYVLVAVPFSTMAKEVFSFMRNVIRGQGFQFARILLPKALNVSREGKEPASALTITKVKYNITADSALESVAMVGLNVAKSGTHNEFLTNVVSGVMIKPESMRLCWNGQFTLSTDNFGHFHFRVAKHASNLAHLPKMLTTLSELGLVETISAFPHMRHLDDNLDDEQ
jgi:hypothetical protein